MTETPLSGGDAPQPDFESQYKRFFAAAGCETQAELAAFLGIRQSSISDAKRRRSIPSDWLLKLFEKRGVNPNWIRTGLGDRMLRPADGGKDEKRVVTVIERRPAKDCTTEELLAEIARRVINAIG